MCSQTDAGNVISEKKILKFPGEHAPSSIPLANSCLRYSAHIFGARILCWGRARKMGPLAVLPNCPTTEESLKNALSWDNHLDELCKKDAAGIGAIKRLRPYFNSLTLLSVYYAVVQPYFDYCYLVWDPIGTTKYSKIGQQGSS